jgi:hypothetical protein
MAQSSASWPFGPSGGGLANIRARDNWNGGSRRGWSNNALYWFDRDRDRRSGGTR